MPQGFLQRQVPLEGSIVDSAISKSNRRFNSRFTGSNRGEDLDEREKLFLRKGLEQGYLRENKITGDIEKIPLEDIKIGVPPDGPIDLPDTSEVDTFAKKKQATLEQIQKRSLERTVTDQPGIGDALITGFTENPLEIGLSVAAGTTALLATGSPGVASIAAGTFAALGEGIEQGLNTLDIGFGGKKLGPDTGNDLIEAGFVGGLSERVGAPGLLKGVQKAKAPFASAIKQEGREALDALRQAGISQRKDIALPPEKFTKGTVLASLLDFGGNIKEVAIFTSAGSIAKIETVAQAIDSSIERYALALTRGSSKEDIVNVLRLLVKDNRTVYADYRRAAYKSIDQLSPEFKTIKVKTGTRDTGVLDAQGNAILKDVFADEEILIKGGVSTRELKDSFTALLTNKSDPLKSMPELQRQAALVQAMPDRISFEQADNMAQIFGNLADASKTASTNEARFALALDRVLNEQMDIAANALNPKALRMYRVAQGISKVEIRRYNTQIFKDLLSANLGDGGKLDSRTLFNRIVKDGSPETIRLVRREVKGRLKAKGSGEFGTPEFKLKQNITWEGIQGQWILDAMGEATTEVSQKKLLRSITKAKNNGTLVELFPEPKIIDHIEALANAKDMLFRPNATARGGLAVSVAQPAQLVGIAGLGANFLGLTGDFEGAVTGASLFLLFAPEMVGLMMRNRAISKWFLSDKKVGLVGQTNVRIMSEYMSLLAKENIEFTILPQADAAELVQSEQRIDTRQAPLSTRELGLGVQRVLPDGTPFPEPGQFRSGL